MFLYSDICRVLYRITIDFMADVFKFKQFEVAQERCAMKVGTDGVLLGAWVQPTRETYSVLDIGAGTGVISLMMAQRFPEAHIEAIEIDNDAFEQTVENFENSPWGDRLFCFHASFQEYFQEVEEEYDLIISNPPYHLATQKTADDAKNLARFEDALPFEHLLYGAKQLLAKEGTFAVVIPYEQEDRFLDIAVEVRLFPVSITHVKGHKGASIKRSLLQLQHEAVEEIKLSELVIEIERHQYTSDYVDLVKDFYLKM